MSGLAHRDRGPRCVSDVELDQLQASDLAGLPEENRVRHHLEECGRCRARLASFQSVAPVAPAAETLQRREVAVRRRLWRAAVAVAALGAAAGIGLAVGQRFGHRHDANAADQAVARRAAP